MSPLSENFLSQDPIHLFSSSLSMRSPSISSSSLNSDYLCNPSGFEELSSALEKTKSRSSPGLDKISFLVLKNIPESSLNLLLHIYNSIFDRRLFPDPWRDFLIFLLLKTALRKFRPIALASCFLKLLERLILNRLYFWLENNNFLPESQFGFRKDRSCSDNLAILLAEICLASPSNEFTACLFLDISAAYDNVIPNILLDVMLQLGIPKIICIFKYNLKIKQKIFFRINGENKSPHILFKGLPQGCILSPILYIIYTNHIHKVIHPDCKILEYADDIALFVTSDDMEEGIQILQHSLNNVNSFFFLTWTFYISNKIQTHISHSLT